MKRSFLRRFWIVSGIAAALLSLATMVVGGLPANAATTTVDISATRSWQSTGVQVSPGTIYTVTQIGGNWTVDYRSFSYVSGAGYSAAEDARIYQGCKLNSAWRYGVLVARIGNSVFTIGRSRSFSINATGPLELSIHDNARCLGDNAGFLRIQIATRPQAPTISWSANAISYRGQVGTRLQFRCPAGGIPGGVWGTDLYTDDSSICTAAVHAGRITLESGGVVTLIIQAGSPQYIGTNRNGIITGDYGSWPGSYSLG